MTASEADAEVAALDVASEEQVQDDAEAIPPEATLLKDLVILPPRQKNGDAKLLQQQALRLPPIRAEEPVQSLCAALSEVVGFAHMTNYRFELDNKNPAAAAVIAEKNDSSKVAKDVKFTTATVMSPYTGRDAVVAVPHRVKSLEDDPSSKKDKKDDDGPVVLDEFADLTLLLEKGLTDGSAFCLVLERYDAASVRDHINRLRTLLEGNAPCVTSLVEDMDIPEDEVADPAAVEADGEATTTKENQAKDAEAVEAAKETEKKDAKEGGEEKEKVEPLPKLPDFKGSNFKVDGSKLEDFFYLACGEDPAAYLKSSSPASGEPTKESKSKKKKKAANKAKSLDKKGGKVVTATISAEAAIADDEDALPEEVVREKIPRLNELEEATRIPCTIRYSGFHPPPSPRRCMGDLAYLEVTLPADDDGELVTLHITATCTGFYVNRSSTAKGRAYFDPSPAAKPCFSHALLDCLLQASEKFAQLWIAALEASKERAVVLNALNAGPFVQLFRMAIRGDFGGFQTPAGAALAAQALDVSLSTPSWIVPRPRNRKYAVDLAGSNNGNSDLDPLWNGNLFHSFNPSRVDEELCQTHGLDIRNGGIRDWNEELQIAREMPTETLHERIERARIIHKVLTEFGEASLLGVKAIHDGQILPMNPNEATRSQVYLHNNIFFSRAVDAGPETFKFAKGDRAARKSANRDIQCISTFHRMEKSGLHTLATVLIDYLGTRFVCQSIMPGILIGERAHTLLFGSVEANIPLKWNEEFHKTLEEKVGECMMVATRKVLKNPLTDERLEELKNLKKATPYLNLGLPEKKEDEADTDPKAMISTCIPIEAKGILGSDKRTYVLDFGRLTPRDANWVPQEKGGTGLWEPLKKQQNGAAGGKPGSNNAIPPSLDDDEWTTCVLRPELISRFTQYSMSKYLVEKKEKESKEKEEAAKADGSAKTEDAKEKDSGASDTAKDVEKKDAVDNEEKLPSADPEKEEEEKADFTEEDMEFLKTLRLNINVFLPDLKPLDGIDDEAAEQLKHDEERVREAATYLWEDVIPKLSRAVKEGTVHQVPLDGKQLTELIHRHGINCRYLGRLAVLAREQEARDVKTMDDLKQGRLTIIERRTMPKCWLELLECEMVARAAKHVLDGYLTERGGVASFQPAQTVASFLSALISESEETAAQTETRIEKRLASEPDEDDYQALTICDTGGEGDAIPAPIRGRYEVWQDIEAEVGRRFRYTLTLYNNGNKAGRALYLPLLRRVCQRTGIRLAAKNYETGDVVPLMKHIASYGEGFFPCLLGPTITLPPLQVSLQDARIALERAHIQMTTRGLGRALELAQDAASLYQRVTEHAAHPGVIESLELMATVFLEAGDAHLAAANGAKALGLAVQSGGFDSATVFGLHMSVFQMLFATRQLDRSVKHLRAAIYLLELMGGSNHIELFGAYHKLGSVYSHADYNGKYLESARRFFQDVSQRDPCDRLMDGVTAKNFAKVLAGLGEYKDALEAEKKAYNTLSMFLGADHQWTKESDRELQEYTKLAVEKGNRTLETDKLKEEVAKAEAIAAGLAAEEEKKKKKAPKKKPTKKK